MPRKTCSKDTGSHELSCLFGVKYDGPKTIIQTVDNEFNTETFLDFRKTIHSKVSKMLSIHGQSTTPL